MLVTLGKKPTKAQTTRKITPVVPTPKFTEQLEPEVRFEAQSESEVPQVDSEAEIQPQKPDIIKTPSPREVISDSAPQKAPTEPQVDMQERKHVDISRPSAQAQVPEPVETPKAQPEKASNKKSPFMNLKEQREAQLRQLGKAPAYQLSQAPPQPSTPSKQQITSTTPKLGKKQIKKEEEEEEDSVPDNYETIREDVMTNSELEELQEPVTTSNQSGQTCLGTKRYGQRCNITQVGANGYCLFHQLQATRSSSAALIGSNNYTNPNLILEDVTGEQTEVFEEAVSFPPNIYNDKEPESAQALKVVPPKPVPQYLFVLPNIYTKLEDGVHHGYRVAE